MAQIVTAADGCLVRAMLTEWYKDKTCVYCGKPFGELEWLEHKRALMSREHVTLDWSEIAAEKLQTCWRRTSLCARVAT